MLSVRNRKVRKYSAKSSTNLRSQAAPAETNGGPSKEEAEQSGGMTQETQSVLTGDDALIEYTQRVTQLVQQIETTNLLPGMKA